MPTICCAGSAVFCPRHAPGPVRNSLPGAETANVDPVKGAEGHPLSADTLARPIPRYLLGDDLSALDIYLATFLTPALASETDCPTMLPALRPAFAYLKEQAPSVSTALADHRAFVFQHHLPYPISL